MAEVESLATKGWWNDSDDAYEMIEWLFQSRGYQQKSKMLMGGSFHGPVESMALNVLTIPLYRYYLASCRRIWKLLPMEGSRKGIEAAEQYLDGKISDFDISMIGGHAEGAAFAIDYFIEPELIAKGYREFSDLPREEQEFIAPSRKHHSHTYILLLNAAYFAYYAMAYPSFHSNGPPPKHYAVFLNADLLRNYVSIDSSPSPGSILTDDGAQGGCFPEGL